MDVLNFISWLKSKRQVTTVDASQTLIPLGLKDARRSDGYLPGAISVEDFLALSPGLPDFIQYNETDKTLWNNGTGTDGSLSLGERALKSIVSGNNNTAIGYAALENNLNGYNNTALGLFALKNTINGNNNTAIGAHALNSNTTGDDNVAIGRLSLGYNITGSLNTSIGGTSLFFNTVGGGNTTVGYGAMFQNSTGYNNTAVGVNALNNNTLGSGNVALGTAALGYNTTGINNVAIGPDTNSGNFNGSVILGKEAAATGSNQFVVGSSSWNVGTIATEALTPTKSWAVRINGVNYKIPLQIA
jgi:hypothetical protein